MTRATLGTRLLTITGQDLTARHAGLFTEMTRT